MILNFTEIGQNLLLNWKGALSKFSAETLGSVLVGSADLTVFNSYLQHFLKKHMHNTSESSQKQFIFVQTKEGKKSRQRISIGLHICHTRFSLKEL